MQLGKNPSLFYVLLLYLSYGYMGVSKNRGTYLQTPNHPLKNRVFNEINHPFWGVKSPLFLG